MRLVRIYIPRTGIGLASPKAAGVGALEHSGVPMGKKGQEGFR